MKRLWQLLELTTAMATAADAEAQLEQIAVLCESAAATARSAALKRPG